MIQLLPQSNIPIPNTGGPDAAVEYINSYIDSTSCRNMNIDISFMNIMDACYVSTMCSTKHFVKFPDGKISWIISSERTKELSKPLCLGNSDFIVCKK